MELGNVGGGGFEDISDIFSSIIVIFGVKLAAMESDKDHPYGPERFECVAVDPELKAQYKEVILVISTIDAMLKQLESVAEQDRVMGPCIAYEKLVEYGSTEPRCVDDPGYKDALNLYAQKAHDFVQALRDAEECEKRHEFGSALANYYRALCLYPKSTLAGQGASKVSDIIVQAQY